MSALPAPDNNWLKQPLISLGALSQSMDNSPDYAIGWGTLALITAGIAQGKNRSGGNWFLLAFLLGPLATFILVAFYDNLE